MDVLAPVAAAALAGTAVGVYFAHFVPSFACVYVCVSLCVCGWWFSCVLVSGRLWVRFELCV